MPREPMLARVVVITTVAVAATVIGLGVASSSEKTGQHHLAASAQASTVAVEAAPTAGPAPATGTAPIVTTTTPAAVAPTTAEATAPAAAPAPVTTAVATTATTAPAPTTVVAGGGIAIGDSVLEDVSLYAPTALTARGVVINAAVSRQWSAGVTIVSTLRASGRLPAVVVVALGSNGPVSSADFDRMMATLGGVRRVVFMTVTGPLIANNNVIRAGVARYPQAVLVDWAGLAAAHPTWFAKDHVHVGAAGAAALGQLFASAV